MNNNDDKKYSDRFLGAMGHQKGSVGNENIRIGRVFGGRNPYTGEKDPNASGAAAGGLIFLIIAAIPIVASYAISTVATNLYSNWALKDKNKKTKIFDFKKNLKTHSLNLMTPLLGAVAGSKVAEISTTENGIIAGCATAAAVMSANVTWTNTLADCNKFKIGGIFALAVAAGVTSATTNSKYGFWSKPTYMTYTDGINVHTQPDFNSVTLNTYPLPNRTCLHVIEKQPDWLKVKFHTEARGGRPSQVVIGYVSNVGSASQARGDRECTVTRLANRPN